MATTKAKPKRIWDNYEEIGEVRKSSRIKFIIAAASRDGLKYVNIREFYLRQKDNIWRPGRDGITIPLIAPLDKGAEFIKPIENMLELINRAADFASTMEIADPDKAVWYYPANKE